MYTIQLVPYTLPFSPNVPNWPQYKLDRGYRVKNGGEVTNVFGYIVEKNEISTIIQDNNETYTTSEDIYRYTNGSIKNASRIFYRLFPVINGFANVRDMVFREETYSIVPVYSEVHRVWYLSLIHI